MPRHLIFIAALALVAAACSGSEAGSTTSSTVTSLVVTTTSTSPPTTAVRNPGVPTAAIEVWVPAAVVTQLDEAKKDFEIDIGVGVNITAVEPDEVLNRLLADPASGPHVFIGPHSWLAILTDAGVVEPVPPRTRTPAGALEGLTIRGVVFGVPLGLDTTVQFRNTDALATAPNAVDTFADGCPDGDRTGPCLLLDASSVEGHLPFLTTSGGYVFGPDEFDVWNINDVGIDTPEALAGALILETIVDGAGILGAGGSTVEERFALGDAPLLWGGTASLAALREAGAVFTVEELPAVAEIQAQTVVRATAAWVNAFAPGKEAALTFVTEYLSAPQTADPVALALGLAPANIGFDADPDLVPFIDAAVTGRAEPTIFETAFAWDRLANAFGEIRDGDDSAAVLATAAEEIRNAPGPEVGGEEEAEEG